MKLIKYISILLLLVSHFYCYSQEEENISVDLQPSEFTELSFKNAVHRLVGMNDLILTLRILKMDSIFFAKQTHEIDSINIHLKNGTSWNVENAPKRIFFLPFKVWFGKPNKELEDRIYYLGVLSHYDHLGKLPTELIDSISFIKKISNKEGEELVILKVKIELKPEKHLGEIQTEVIYINKSLNYDFDNTNKH